MTTTVAASTVGGVHRETVLAGSTPEEVATLLVMLLEHPTQQTALADAGLLYVNTAHGEAAIADALRTLIAGIDHE